MSNDVAALVVYRNHIKARRFAQANFISYSLFLGVFGGVLGAKLIAAVGRRTGASLTASLHGASTRPTSTAIHCVIAKSSRRKSAAMVCWDNHDGAARVQIGRRSFTTVACVLSALGHLLVSIGADWSQWAGFLVMPTQPLLIPAAPGQEGSGSWFRASTIIEPLYTVETL
jgi:hypothetical protein